LRGRTGDGNPGRINIMQLNVDPDLFADGSFVVKRWRGHTPGSQMGIVRLKKGSIILTEDSVYLCELVTSRFRRTSCRPSIGKEFCLPRNGSAT